MKTAFKNIANSVSANKAAEANNEWKKFPDC